MRRPVGIVVAIVAVVIGTVLVMKFLVLNPHPVAVERPQPPNSTSSTPHGVPSSSATSSPAATPRSTSPSGPTATGTPTATPTPTPTSTGGGTGTVAATNTVSGNIPVVATDTTWWASVAQQLQDRGVHVTLVYGGRSFDDDTIINLMDTVSQYGQTFGLNVGWWYQNGGLSAVQDVIRVLSTHPAFQRVVVSANDIGSVSQVNDLVDAIQAITTVPVNVGSDNTGDVSNNVASFQRYHGTTTSGWYAPFDHNAYYGTIDHLGVIGQADAQAKAYDQPDDQGSKAMAWVEAFDWRWLSGSLPDLRWSSGHLSGAGQMGFHTPTDIKVDNVTTMTQLQVHAGPSNIMVMFLEPKADSANYVIRVLAAQCDLLN
jgi:hypothetical protein